MTSICLRRSSVIACLIVLCNTAAGASADLPKMRSQSSNAYLPRGRSFFAPTLLFAVLSLTGCSTHIATTGYAVVDTKDFTFPCGPVQYVRAPTISRSQTTINGPPLVPLAPSMRRIAYLQVNIKPVDKADATMCPTVIVNGKEFTSITYSTGGACGYRFDGLELTEESLMVALENRVIGCRVDEVEYKYYESNRYIPLHLPTR